MLGIIGGRHARRVHCEMIVHRHRGGPAQPARVPGPNAWLVTYGSNAQ